MKNIRKGVLSLLVLFLALIYGGDMKAVNAAGTEPSFKYEVNSDNTITISGMTNITEDNFDIGDLVIPETIDGYIVSGIGSRGISGGRITSVNIPKYVTNIHSRAFEGSHYLENIYVDQENEKYSSIDGVLVSKDKKTLIKYPEHRSSSIYEIPGSIEKIKAKALGMTHYFDSESGPYWGNSDYLETIIIGKNVKTIEAGAFMNRRKLQEIFVSSSNQNFQEVDGVLFSKDKKILYLYPAGKSATTYKIPATVTKIAGYAFWRAENLDKITISKNVTQIGDEPFGYTFCSKLWFPGTLKKIGKNVNYIGTEYRYVEPGAVEGDYFAAREKYADIYFGGTAKQWKQIPGNSYYEPVLFNSCTNYSKHTNKVTIQRATIKQAGKKVNVCKVCGKKVTTAKISRIKKVSLSTASYVYNGKMKTPTVTVRNVNGTKLKKGTDYTVSYAKGRKKVGKYTITVKFKGKYTGTVKKTFKIKPRTTSITKVRSGRKSFTVKWSKRSTQTTGYQICYGTSKNKEKGKKVTVKSYKTTSKKIRDLKRNKKYYVWVRTYKTVNGTKYYSDWSSRKYVTTK